MLRLRITSTAEWKVRSGHPRIFAESIKSQSRNRVMGELAVVYDKWDNFLAIGLFDPFRRQACGSCTRASRKRLTMGGGASDSQAR